VPNTTLLAPISGRCVQDEPPANLDQVAFKGLVRNANIVEQRQSGKMFGRSHINLFAASFSNALDCFRYHASAYHSLSISPGLRWRKAEPIAVNRGQARGSTKAQVHPSPSRIRDVNFLGLGIEDARASVVA
jgi:hypothetical protein